MVPYCRFLRCGCYCSRRYGGVSGGASLNHTNARLRLPHGAMELLRTWFANFLLHPLQIVPVIATAVAAECPDGYARSMIITGCVAVVAWCMGEMMRRAEQAAHKLSNVTNVVNGDPQVVMRAAAQWGSEVLGRVARGQPGADAVIDASVVHQMDGGQSEASSACVSEQELNGFASEPRNHSSWIYNAIRSVTPSADGVTPRDVARMGTVPETVPYHGQPLAMAQPPMRRAPSSPAR